MLFFVSKLKQIFNKVKSFNYKFNQKRIVMKQIKILLFAVTVLVTGSLYSQDKNETQFLLNNGSGKVNVSGFGTFNIGFSSFDNDLAVYNGCGGAVLLNQTLYFGIYGMGLSTQHGRDGFTMINNSGTPVTYEQVYTQFAHGGFWLGYIHKSSKPVHFGASTKFGWGGASLTNQQFSSGYDEPYNYYSIVTDEVFVFTPQIEVEVNLLKWFKMNASAGYQFVTGLDKYYINENGNQVDFFNSSDFNQPVFNLSFVFGWFVNKS
jgi:hypothetical protein